MTYELINNYEMKIQVNETLLVKHYLKLHPDCQEWEVPEPEELIIEVLQQLEAMGITVIDRVEPEREIIGHNKCCFSPIYK